MGHPEIQMRASRWYEKVGHPSKWVPAAAIAGIDTLGFCVLLAILEVVGKFGEGPKTSET